IELAKEILKLVAGVGALAAITIAPGLGPMFRALMSKKRERHFNGCVNQALKRLEKRGFLKVELRGGRKLVLLTAAGEQILKKMELAQLKIKKPKKWDNHWWFVIFDVRENDRKLRDHMRNTLLNIGFKRLQDSVWVHPYPCEVVIELMRSGYNLRREILYFSAARFPGDYPLLKFFRLT
ncbi:MAG: hypothetical protein AAB731_02290, partial [Patescibacteria group bacterium]